jgi:hypothetical protein
MANRGKFRRKMVLPVTVVRSKDDEKQVAHTLDVTEVSARLGGLRIQLEPGEIIEIQRGGVKAKFQVHWMGTPGTELEGHAGIQGLDPGKSIWSTHLPADQTDLAVDAFYLRQGAAMHRGAPVSRPERSETLRYECSASATVRPTGSSYPFRVQVKTIHLGGIEVESINTLPLNTAVNLEMKVEGVQVESAGVVTGSTPRLGMEISFHKVTQEIQRKIVQVLQKIKQKAWDEEQVTLPVMIAAGPSIVSSTQKAPAASGRTDPFRELAAMCKVLREDWDYWKSTHTTSEIEELCKAVVELEEMLSPARIDLHEYVLTGEPESSGRV